MAGRASIITFKRDGTCIDCGKTIKAGTTGRYLGWDRDSEESRVAHQKIKQEDGTFLCSLDGEQPIPGVEPVAPVKRQKEAQSPANKARKGAKKSRNVSATRHAEALAKEYNIDLSTVTGTGTNGKIRKADVQDAIDEEQDTDDQPSADSPLSIDDLKKLLKSDDDLLEKVAHRMMQGL